VPANREEKGNVVAEQNTRNQSQDSLRKKKEAAQKRIQRLAADDFVNKKGKSIRGEKGLGKQGTVFGAGLTVVYKNERGGTVPLSWRANKREGERIPRGGASVKLGREWAKRAQENREISKGRETTWPGVELSVKGNGGREVSASNFN